MIEYSHPLRKEKYKLSIIIVTYNASKTLQSTLDSIVDLKLLNTEIVIVDGKSTDKTLDVLNNNKDDIAYYISESDTGIYNAMNKAIDFCRGDFVYFLGADDLVLSDFNAFLSLCNDSNIVYYGNVRLLNSGNIYAGKFNKYKLMQQNICHQAIIYPRSLLCKFKYNEKYKLLADYDLNIRLFSKFKFKYINKCISLYNEDGLSSGGDLFFHENKLSIIKDNFGIILFHIKKIRNFFVDRLKKI